MQTHITEFAANNPLKHTTSDVEKSCVIFSHHIHYKGFWQKKEEPFYKQYVI